jgi:hypothetical protein
LFSPSRSATASLGTRKILSRGHWKP